MASKSEVYISEQIAEATFQQFISLFEYFYFDLLRLWLLEYPQNLVNKQIDFKSVLEAPDKEAITLLVVNREINEILYDRPSAWFAYLNARAKLGCPTAEEIDRIAEAKATRDALVHNRGVAGRTYGQKAGKLARFPEGERIEVSETYHRETWDLLCNVVAAISDAAIAKAS